MSDQYNGTAALAAQFARFVAGDSDPMQEILGSSPWECDEYGHTWHMGTVWVDTTSDTGFTLDKFSDGDHEEIDEDEANLLLDSADAAWKRYAAWVAEHGDDPLSNYMVTRTIERTEAWEAFYEEHDGRAVLKSAMLLERPTWIAASDLPADVREYFNVGNMTVAELAAALKDSNKKGDARVRGEYRVIDLEVRRKIPVPDEQIANELRELARSQS